MTGGHRSGRGRRTSASVAALLAIVIASSCLQSCGTYIAIVMESDHYRKSLVFPGIRVDADMIAGKVVKPSPDESVSGCVTAGCLACFFTLDLPFSFVADVTYIPLGAFIQWIKGESGPKVDAPTERESPPPAQDENDRKS